MISMPDLPPSAIIDMTTKENPVIDLDIVWKSAWKGIMEPHHIEKDE